jgi:hypothetical protein
MKFTQEEIVFVKDNKVMIQGILDKKLTDILDDVMYSKDEEKVKVLRLWAREIKELILALDNLSKVKKEKNDTGI